MYQSIPEPLKNKAKGDPAWSRLMVEAFANAERARIVTARLVFFPEYTDHGPTHVSQVIAVAWRVVGEASRGAKGLSAADASALAIAALLHDIAMHVSEPSFASLIAPASRWRSLEGWDEPSWATLWRDYLAEARRWDDRKRRDVFGEGGPDEVIEAPPFGGLAMRKGHRMLVGEFLRSHHPRLAHEIAVYGFPAAGGGAVPILPPDARPFVPDLLGLVARSHGLPLRAAVDRLDRPNHRRHREFHGAHPVFLMALLRIGDYLHLQADRAPEAALQLEPLLSPVSQAEWVAHAAIDEVRLGGDDDPEVLFVRALPDTVRTHAKVRSWLDGLQQELDQCWPVIGETYGANPKKYRLDLAIRRVKSNLDERAAFARAVDYVPEQIAFTTSGGRLLKLLVGPLTATTRPMASAS